MPRDKQRSNADRVKLASAILAVYAVNRVCDSNADAVTDLLADLGHYCDARGLDLSLLVTRAANHYREETNRQGTQFYFLD